MFSLVYCCFVVIVFLLFAFLVVFVVVHCIRNLDIVLQGCNSNMWSVNGRECKMTALNLDFTLDPEALKTNLQKGSKVIGQYTLMLCTN